MARQIDLNNPFMREPNKNQLSLRGGKEIRRKINQYAKKHGVRVNEYILWAVVERLESEDAV